MMTDLHIEMRYGLPEFTFDLPDGWQLEPLTKATVDKTVELVLGPESPAAERDRLTESVRADLHRDRAFALVRFDDESRGHSRVWLSLQALTAPADSSIGHLASAGSSPSTTRRCSMTAGACCGGLEPAKACTTGGWVAPTI